jgi:hypothetical protein
MKMKTQEYENNKNNSKSENYNNKYMHCPQKDASPYCGLRISVSPKDMLKLNIQYRNIGSRKGLVNELYPHQWNYGVDIMKITTPMS